MSERTTAAIATYESRTPDLWVVLRKPDADGRRGFWVINGEWSGSIRPDGTIHVEARSPPGYSGTIVWEGHAPFRHDEYNEALAWIASEIATTE